MITAMRKAEPLQLIDWLATSLRWLFLLGIILAYATAAPLNPSLQLTLALAAAWNVILTILASVSRRLPAHPYLSTIVDMLIAYAIYFLAGTVLGPVVWVGLLPLVTASLYFKLRGALVVLVINMLSQGLLALVDVPLLTALVSLAILIPIYLAVALIFSFIKQRMAGVVETTVKLQIAEQRESLRAENERHHAIFNLISALSSSLNMQRVLDTALDLSTSALLTLKAPADQLFSAILLFKVTESGQAELQVGSARRLTPADQRVRLPGRSGLIAKAIEDGEPRLTKTLQKDPELTRYIALRVCKAAYCIPLRSGLDTYGVLVYAHPELEFFTPEYREILDIVGKQVSIAIQNARLYQDLEEEKERMMEIQEEARKKMARDLHDGPTQSVAAIAMRVNFARRLMERDAKAAAEELFKIEDLARRTTKEIRHMLFTLRPLVLESSGLISALESMAEKMHETYGQNVVIQAEREVVTELEMNKQAVTFYIAEEAVNNARKHAQAETIWVRLRKVQDDLGLLEIEDNGLGFDLNSVDSNYDNRGSLGMINMRERAELVNGIIQIDSAEDKGTRIRVLIPFTEEAADKIRRGM
jgi:signal transduction histidine kinase